MLISTPVEIAEQSALEAIVDDQIYVGQEYIGIAPKTQSTEYGKDIAGDTTPQGYLVKQPPGSVTRPHFHQTNQFQVFVGGSGTVGKVRTDPITVQYAGGYTPYGPIKAEAQGLDYFTLRQCWDSGAKYLPQQRDLLKKGRQRQRLGRVDAAALENNVQTLIPEEDDGLLVQHYQLSANQSISLPDGRHAGGQYHVVTAGAIVRDETVLGPLSLEFASADTGVLSVQAGPDGAEILLLRFPRLATNAP